MGSDNRLRRKLAIASWGSPHEGNIYGKLTLDVGPALTYLEQLEERTGERVSITHLVGKAVGEALKAEPSINGRILFGRFRPHDEVSLAFLVSTDDGDDLTRARIRNVDRKGLTEVARELKERSARLRDGTDEDWERSKSVVRALPPVLLRPVLWLVGWLSSALGVNAPAVGIERFPFGSAIVTSVGMMGLDEAFVPPTPFARVPLYVLVGAVRERPAVVDGEVVSRQQLTITATLDHRFVDGAQAAVLARAFRRAFEDPASLEHAPEPAATAPRPKRVVGSA